MYITKSLIAVLTYLLTVPFGGRTYGYQMIGPKGTGLKPGSLYPILHRLEAAGWIVGQFDDPSESGRPPRRYYEWNSTGTGRSAAEEIVFNYERRGLHGSPSLAFHPPSE